MSKVSMTVNGKAVTADADARTLLVQYLREGLRLTGTHVGCDTSQCGACVVHINGKAVKSLRTGKWTFSVDDESRKAGFDVQALNGKQQMITSAVFVGSHDATVSLKAGRWFFFTPEGVKVTFFVVS